MTLEISSPLGKEAHVVLGETKPAIKVLIEDEFHDKIQKVRRQKIGL